MVRRWMGSTLVVLAFTLLGGASTAAPSGSVSAPRTSVVEFPLPHPESRPYSIVTGPDGNLWFTESDRGAIGRITPTGEITEFDLPDSGAGPYGITVGSDGNLWFTERFANLIGKMTPTGELTEYNLPTPNA